MADITKGSSNMVEHSSPVTAVPPADLAERIALYLDDMPSDGAHSDAAGADCWELLREAMEELRRPAQTKAPVFEAPVFEAPVFIKMNEAQGVTELLDQEEKYLLEHFTAECGIMPGDVEGSFHRIREALHAPAQCAFGEALAQIAAMDCESWIGDAQKVARDALRSDAPAQCAPNCDLLQRLRDYLMVNMRPGNDLAPKYIKEIDAALTSTDGGGSDEKNDVWFLRQEIRHLRIDNARLRDEAAIRAAVTRPDRNSTENKDGDHKRRQQ